MFNKKIILKQKKINSDKIEKYCYKEKAISRFNFFTFFSVFLFKYTAQLRFHFIFSLVYLSNKEILISIFLSIYLFLLPARQADNFVHLSTKAFFSLGKTTATDKRESPQMYSTCPSRRQCEISEKGNCSNCKNSSSNSSPFVTTFFLLNLVTLLVHVNRK